MMSKRSSMKIWPARTMGESSVLRKMREGSSLPKIWISPISGSSPQGRMEACSSFACAILDAVPYRFSYARFSQPTPSQNGKAVWLWRLNGKYESGDGSLIDPKSFYLAFRSRRCPNNILFSSNPR
jgi:hypothetical protein